MKLVNTHEAKTHFSRLLDEVSRGGEFVIAKAGRPVARLIRYESIEKPRQLGLLLGKVTESSDCWEPDEDLASSIDTLLYQNLPPLPSANVAEAPAP
jgi:prevent-host-death family protein